MNKKLKESLFQAYEKEMKFSGKKAEVKSRLSFAEKKPVRPFSVRYRYALVGATCVAVCALTVSSHFAFSPLIKAAGAKPSVSEEKDGKGSVTGEFGMIPPNNGLGSSVGSFSFGEGNLYSVSYSYSIENNMVRFTDVKSNMDLEELILKEGEETLQHIEKEEHAFSVQLSSGQKHILFYEYQSYSGTVEL